jgi:hypothetical protein
MLSHNDSMTCHVGVSSGHDGLMILDLRIADAWLTVGNEALVAVEDHCY